MSKWKVEFTDDESDGVQIASFDTRNDAELWIKNEEVHERYDHTGFEVVDGPYEEK